MLDMSVQRVQKTQQRANSGAGRRRGRRAMPRHKVLTLEEVTHIYYEDCRVQSYKPSTIMGYRCTLRCFLRWAGEEAIITLPQFTGETIKRYIAYIQLRHTYAGHRFTPEQPERVDLRANLIRLARYPFLSH